MTRFAFSLVLIAACAKDNPYFCDDCAMPDAASSACVDPDDCSGSTPICDQGTCVACTADEVGSCAGTSPVCSAAQTCMPCDAHAQCGSDACLPTGACGTDTNVAYVTMSGTDTGSCTFAAPCGTLTYAAMQSKPYIKVQSDLDQAVTFANVSVTVLGENTTLKRTLTTQGPVVTVSGTSDVTLTNLTIREGAGTGGHGVYVNSGDSNVKVKLDRVNVVANAGNGVSIGGGTITMTRCVVSGNFAGGANINNAAFDITNSLFVRNGTSASTVGGVFLLPNGGTSVFSFNTVANNDSSSVSVAARGINCALAVNITNTIVSTNQTKDCTFEYSLFDTGVGVTGTNRAGDPMFKYVDGGSPLRADYFRIDQASAAIDQAQPASTMTTDIDGDMRPQGGVPDIGADEYK